MPRVTITIAEKGPQPYRFDLKREIVTIGRGLDNDIVVACGSVSGKHSEMRRVEGGYHLIDVGSTNGIKVDGVRQQKVSLKNGMTVKLGDVEFGFTLNEEELAVIDAEREALSEEEENEVEFSEKKVSEKQEDAEEDDEEEEDDLDKLPELRPARLDKSKEKEEQEAAKQKKAEEKERAKRQEKADKEEKAQQKVKDQRSERRKKRESSEKSNERDEYSESKAVTIGSGFILFTLIAAATTFFYGASTRHEKDTGEKLLKGIVNKENAKKDAPSDVDNKDKSKDGAE
ncbi:MAG: FHA domain-containing protein [Akkermansiaceae bacterium]|jgi:pSer/pThr/pTyr-binding forkhead associated (FHA) protein